MFMSTIPHFLPCTSMRQQLWRSVIDRKFHQVYHREWNAVHLYLKTTNSKRVFENQRAQHGVQRSDSCPVCSLWTHDGRVWRNYQLWRGFFVTIRSPTPSGLYTCVCGWVFFVALGVTPHGRRVRAFLYGANVLHNFRN